MDPISYRLIECITFTYFVMHAGHCTTTGMLLGSLVVAKRVGNIQSMKWHAQDESDFFLWACVRATLDEHERGHQGKSNMK